MSYKDWLISHAKKHYAIMQKLEQCSDEEIIEYFKFENMVQNEPDFCPLYKDKKKCHDIEKLNCYLCACPNFKVGEVKSYCTINSKYGSFMLGKDGYIHQDCSKCSVPHNKSYVRKHFNRDWKIVFKDCIEGEEWY